MKKLFVGFFLLSLSFTIGCSTVKKAPLAKINIDQTMFLKGQVLYQKSCTTCHGDNGRGELRGVPDLTIADGVMGKSDEDLRNSIWHGYQSPNSISKMPRKGGNRRLKKADLESLLYFMRESFR